MSGYNFTKPVYTYSASNDKDITVYADMTCAGEDYLDDGAHFEGYAVGYNWRGRHLVYETVNNGCYVFESSTTGRYAFIVPSASFSDGRYILVDSDARSTKYYGLLNFNFHYRDFDDPDYGYDTTGGQFPENIGTYDGYSTHADIASNVPIFKYEDYAQAQEYVKQTSKIQADAILKQYALNYGDEPAVFDDTSKYYFIYNTYSSATSEMGEIDYSDTVYSRYERLLVNPTDKNDSPIALYRYSDDPFEYHLAYDDNSIVASAYSSVSIFAVETSPTWVENSVQYTQPFYRTPYVKVANGSYTIGRTWSTNIPVFGSMQDAVDYINGDKDITQAENWRDISGYYTNIISNNTGDEEEETEFGEVYAQNFFSQQYLCTTGALTEIAYSLYDIGLGNIWELIKQGIEVYGDDPIQVVQGLMFFPVDLSTVFSNVSDQQSLFFGGYQLTINSTVKRVVFANGYKSLGTINILKSFNDYRDYEPYTKLYVYLPYCGTYQLDLARYYGKTVEVRYFIDTRTGGCVACLIANGVLIDYFNGQMGVQMPITLTDKSAYANAQIQTLLGGVSSIGNIAKDTGAGILAGGSLPVGMAFGALNAGLTVAKTEYGLTQNNVNNYNKTKGGSSSMINEYLPQYVTFMFEVQQIDATENQGMLQGFPSNASGSVGSFSGYLEVEEVNLICGNATENEKEKIKSLLRSGVII